MFDQVSTEEATAVDCKVVVKAVEDMEMALTEEAATAEVE